MNVKTTVSIDFDNIYIGLQKKNPQAAEAFAGNPKALNQFLVDMPLPDTGEFSGRRRLLVQKVYMNPNSFQKYRQNFIQAGYEVVDCPPLTQGGKTCTDMQLALDMVDSLTHSTRFDEYILLSADADFTPLLRKLRANNRATTVMAVGPCAGAYRAMVDMMIDTDKFIQDALGCAPSQAQASVIAQTPSSFVREPASSRMWAAQQQTRENSVVQSEVLAPSDSEDMKLFVHKFIKDSMPKGGAFCAALGNELTRAFPQYAKIVGTKGALRNILSTLDLKPYRVDWSISGGMFMEMDAA